MLRFETDGFAKWNAAQKLALDCIVGCYNSPNTAWNLSDSTIAAFQHVLEDETIEHALRAELLTPPGFEEAAAGIKMVDVSLLEDARDFFKTKLSLGLYESAKSIYQTLWQQEDHKMHGQAYGRRKLRNICLWILMKADEARTIQTCQRQFSQAKTMTDQIASFGLLVNCSDKPTRPQAIEDFYQQWKDDELVLDKWFTLQATCELPGTITLVHDLLFHPAFNIKNPNKVRALVGAFSQSNPRHFHAIDGSGYVFLTEMLLTMDKLNPQIAARLATPFTRSQRLDTKRQDLMRHQLERLSGENLSRDLRELVSKSLGG